LLYTQLLAYVFLVAILLATSAQANVASQLSLSTSELYSDNILFSTSKEDDLVTALSPSLTFIYKPHDQTMANFVMSLKTSAEWFAQHSEFNNVGQNLGLDATYVYRYSQRLQLTARERLQRRGDTRTGGMDDFEGGDSISNLGGGGYSGFGGIGGTNRSGRFGDSSGYSGLIGPGNYGRRRVLQSLGEVDQISCRRGTSLGRGSGAFLRGEDLISTGDWLENQIGAGGRFLYSPNLTFRGSYCWGYTAFFDEGGQEAAHSVEVQGTYQRWRQHNLHVRYRISRVHFRDGGSGLLHDFSFGDNFLSSREIHLTPTLTIHASTGIALSTDNGGGGGNNGSGNNNFRIGNQLDLSLTKVWRTALLSTGVQRGFTSSFGVSGPSFTTTFFSSFTLQLSQRLSSLFETDFSLYDTDDTDFKTFQALIGMQYWLTSWLSASAMYSYRWLDPGSGAASTGVLSSSQVDSNNFFISFSAHFDIWPHGGVERVITTPFGATSGSSVPPSSRRPLP
jgi:hypothetical protein